VVSVTRLIDVDPNSATEVALVGELRVDTPEREPDLNVSYAALRTDVGFTIEVYRGSSSTKSFVFKVAERQVRCADGLVLETDEGVVVLEPTTLALAEPIRRTTPCDDAPAGFERIWESPHAGKGPLGRRDTMLLPGDRVELLGKVTRGREGYRERADYRTMGPYELRDLSLGQLTRAEEQARDRKIVFSLIGGALLAIAIGVMISVFI
jgi:hypothetical protein